MLDSALRYESQRSGLGDEFLEEVGRAVEAVAQSPDRWPPNGEDTRRYLLHRFPYGLVYMVREDSVVIVAVAHLRRRPGYWRHRIR